MKLVCITPASENPILPARTANARLTEPKPITYTLQRFGQIRYTGGGHSGRTVGACEGGISRLGKPALGS